MSGGDDLDPAKTAVKASSAAILARILVMNTNFLGQLTAEPSLQLLLQQAGAAVEESILLCLVDIWLDKVSASEFLKGYFINCWGFCFSNFVYHSKLYALFLFLTPNLLPIPKNNDYFI